MSNGSILTDVKTMLGIYYEDNAFDAELIMHINGTFMTLHQLGIGPESGFYITGPDTEWSEFSDNAHLVDSVKMFVFMKVRMIFDPPASSVVADAINQRLSEIEWRLTSQAEMDAEKGGTVES